MKSCPSCGYSETTRPSWCENCNKMLIEDYSYIGEGNVCDHGFDFCSIACLRQFEITFPRLDRTCCMERK